MSSTKPNTWFKNFVGVGYRYHDVYMNVFPLFEEKMFAFKLWKRTVEWWPDDKIRMSFVEQDGNYWFILYHDGSGYKGDNTGFVKKVPVSENYERFKAGFEKKATLRFGIYNENPKKKKEGQKYELEILKKSKSVYNVAFLKHSELAPDSVEWHCIQENKE